MKVLNNLASGNLKVPLCIYEPARCPIFYRSSSKKMAICYEACDLNTYGPRAFSVISPILWNDVPIDIRSIDNVNKVNEFWVEDLSFQ